MADASLLEGKPASSMSNKEVVRLIGTIIKSFIGSGVLFLPKAFENGGWLFSVSSMAFMAVISTLCILRLIRCRDFIQGSYGTVGKFAVGRWGQVAVDVSLVLSQAGFCCVYIVFIARNALQLLNSERCWLDGSWLWLLVLLEWPIFTPLTWVRNIASFGPTNILADVLIGLGLTAVLAWSGSGMSHLGAHAGSSSADGGTGVMAFNTVGAPLMLGTAVYAFEGVGMVVPVFDSLSPVAKRRFTSILCWTLVGIAAVYVTVGLVPYLYMGWAGIDIQDAVTLNLPREGWAMAVVVGYCIALTFSYPLMLFPAMMILERTAAPYLGLRAGVAEAGGHGVKSRKGSDVDAEAAGLEQGDGDGEEVPLKPAAGMSPLEVASSGGVDANGQAVAEPEGEYCVPSDESTRDRIVRNAFRGFVVACTLAVAYGGSTQLDNFVSLIGCFCCTPLAFIYPTLFHLKINTKAGRISRLIDYSVLAFGCGVFVFSTYEAIATWSPTVIDPCPYNKA